MYLLRIGVFCAVLGVFIATPTFADRGLGVLLHGGQSDFSGDLSKNATASIWGMEVTMEPDASKALGFFAGMFLVDITQTSITVKDATPFPFKGGESLSIQEYSVIPTVCMMANLPVQGCLGAGWVQLWLQGNNDLQNYGTFRGDVRFGHYLDTGLIYGIEGHYYNLAQEVSGQRSSFTSLVYQAALGWRW